MLAKHVALNAILALGMTFVVLSGGIDLSVGSIAGLAGMTAGWLLHEGLVLRPLGVVVYFSVPSVIVIGLAVGLAVGALNGLLVVRARVAPFIATLGTLYVARGAALLLSGGATFPNLAGRADLGNTGFAVLGTGTLLRLPAPIWIMAVLGIAFAFVAARTPFGRRVYAVGDNERAAALVGIRVARVKLAVYMHLGPLRGAHRPHHRLSAPGGAPGDRRDVRAVGDRRRGPGRDFAVGRAGQHRRHARRRVRDRRAQRRARAARRLGVLADRDQGDRHRRGRGRRPARRAAGDGGVPGRQR